MLSRYFAAILLLWSVEASAAEPVTVEAAVRQAIARPALVAVIDSEIAAADAQAQAAGLWPNPVLSYEREEVREGGLDVVEQSAQVSQSLDISGRRGLRTTAAAGRAQAARLDGEAARRRAAIEARRRFWAVAHEQARHGVSQAWLARLEAATSLMGKRRDAGENSTYDVLRMEREVRSARAALGRSDVAREAAWLELLALTGDLSAPAGWPRVAGDLAPGAVAPPSDVAKRPDLEAWNLREAAAQREVEAAGRGWVPEIDLGAGWRGIASGGERGSGFTAALSLSFPIFDHGQGDAALARAKAQRAQALGALLAEDARRRRAPAQARAERLAALATKIRAETEAAARDLESTADAAWLGGELEVLELLDVHRGVRDDALDVLDLEHDARQAREDLRAITLRENP
jgi:cobalt-zinc-cadmium efflux system outer membrane protein